MEKHNREFQIGRTDTFTVTLPYDITGYNYACEIETPGGDDIATYTVEIDEDAKSVTFTLSHTVTGVIPKGSYLYDVAEVTASGDVNTLFGGKVNVVNPVTTI